MKTFVDKAGQFIKGEWKRLGILAAFCLLLYCFLFFISYMSNPTEAIFMFSKKNGFIYNFFAFMIEALFSYYLLIFWIVLPFLKAGNWKRFLLLMGILYSVKLLYGFYDFQTSSDLQRANHLKESKALIPENSFGWFFLWFVVFAFFEIAISFCAALVVEWMHKKRQQIVLEKQKVQAELSALKHQINPHFLFNSLNFIYSKSIRFDEDLAHSVMLLSDIMRYALSVDDEKNGEVALEKEVTHLKNVIEINQKRMNNRLFIDYKEQIRDQQIKIIPLVLITLVENAFKHGDLLQKSDPLAIQLYDRDEKLIFMIKNKKGSGVKELSNGIGLSNIQQRLQLTYGDRHRFEIKEDDAAFAVWLEIPIEA